MLYHGETIEGEVPEYYEMTYYDDIRGKYQVIVFFNSEIKDMSVEIDYEDTAFGFEKYTYNLSEQDRNVPAVFILGPDVKNRSFNVDIDEL